MSLSTRLPNWLPFPCWFDFSTVARWRFHSTQLTPCPELKQHPGLSYISRALLRANHVYGFLFVFSVGTGSSLSCFSHHLISWYLSLILSVHEIPTSTLIQMNRTALLLPPWVSDRNWISYSFRFTIYLVQLTRVVSQLTLSLESWKPLAGTL